MVGHHWLIPGRHGHLLQHQVCCIISVFGLTRNWTVFPFTINPRSSATAYSPHFVALCRGWRKIEWRYIESGGKSNGVISRVAENRMALYRGWRKIEWRYIEGGGKSKCWNFSKLVKVTSSDTNVNYKSRPYQKYSQYGSSVQYLQTTVSHSAIISSGSVQFLTSSCPLGVADASSSSSCFIPFIVVW